VEDAVEVALLIAGVEEIVVGKLRIDAVQPQMKHDAGAGWLKSLEPPHYPGRLSQELLACGGHLHVGDNEVRVEAEWKAIGGLRDDTGDRASALYDLSDSMTQMHAYVRLLHPSLKGPGKLV
jgi:hypothetical protein